jgi:hypothetical protein
MTVGAPLGLAALAAVPLLVVLYLLRRRRPPQVVSALFLWRSPDSRASAGPRLQRLVREASLATEIAAVLAASLFLADVRCGAPADEPHTVVVLDGSLSMSAVGTGGAPASQVAVERAREAARADGGRVTLLVSGLPPRVLVGPAAPRSQIESLRYEPTGPDHPLGPALDLAREMAGPRARVRLITDRIPEPSPEGVEVIAVGEPRPNLAFVAASRRDANGRAHVSLRVASFAASSVETTVSLKAEGGALLGEQHLALAPGEERGVVFEATADQPLFAQLPDDALAADNQALLLPNPRRPLRVALRLPPGAAASSIRRLLEADGSASEAEPADLVFAPENQTAAGPWEVRIGTRGEPHAVLGPFFAERGHPLLDGAPLESLLWSGAESPAGRPLLTAGDRVLLSQTEGPSFHFNLDFDRSNLHRTAAWPVILANLLSMRREALSGFPRKALALGDELRVSLEPGLAWQLDGPGLQQPLRGSGSIRLAPPAAPGLYRLLADGVEKDRLAVLAIDRAESDLRSRASGRVPSCLPVGRVSGPRSPRSRWPLAAMIALLCADWILVARSRPGARRSEGAR